MGTNNDAVDVIPCLKLHFQNRNHNNLQKFLNLFSIQRLRSNDFKLVDMNSSHAKEFQEKFIEI